MSKNLSLFMYLLLMPVYLSSCKNEDNEPYKHHKNLDESKAYLIFRGTESKEGIIARKYNIKDTNVTHVGIFLSENNQWSVYHVANQTVNDSSFVKEPFGSFIDPKKENIKYFSIWEILMSESEIKNLRNHISDFEKQKIVFDNQFIFYNDKYYCSEFVCDVLRNVNQKKFDFEIYKKKLNNLESIYLRRDSLEYYPVDVFLYNSHFKMIEEQFLR